MYSLYTQWRHMDPGGSEGDECENRIGLIVKIKEVEPAKAALLALLKMGPTKITQGRLPDKFEHAAYASEESH